MAAPEFITNETLRQIGSRRSKQASYDHSATAAGKDVFLSYSHKDRDALPGVITILENHGASVYVDAGDKSLPVEPSPTTAAILKSNLTLARRLVVFVTNNSKTSAWIPWELGLGDGLKSTSRVALFPAADSAWDQEWARQEYFGLYRRIVWGVLGFGDPRWMVHDYHSNTGTPLLDWLRE